MAEVSSALLSPEFIEQLERLSLVARRPVRGWAAGQRRSRRAGHSVEFCDYRATPRATICATSTGISSAAPIGCT